MTLASDTPWFCRFCSGPLPARSTVTMVDGKGSALSFCSQVCCNDFKAKATRPDAPSSRRKRAAQE